MSQNQADMFTKNITGGTVQRAFQRIYWDKSDMKNAYASREYHSIKNQKNGDQYFVCWK